MKRTSSIISIILALMLVFGIQASAGNGSGGGGGNGGESDTLTLVSAKVGDTDLEGATIPAGSVIALTFSNNVTDDTVFESNQSKIKVINSDETEVSATVEAGSEKTVITVTLGEIEDGDYCLTLGKEISAKNTDLKLGTKITKSFKIKNENEGGNQGGNEGGNEEEKTLSLVSAKSGSTDLKGAKIPAGSEITLTFSNNVTDESVLANNISKIKITASDGKAAASTVSPGTDKTIFTVTLGKDIAKGDYTLTIGKDFKAKNDATLGKNVEIEFSVKGDGSGSGGGNNPLDVVSVKAGDKNLNGAELEANGKITITFSRGMTENQENNFKQIGIYNEKGKKIETVTFTDFTKNDEGNTFTELTYKDLPSGKYTLKLGKDLKANNGNTLGKDQIISFTVKAQNDDDPEEKSIFDKIADFFNTIIDYIRDVFNRILTLFGAEK